MPSEIWVGTVEVNFATDDEPDRRKLGFTVITIWASNFDEFGEKCKKVLEGYGWILLGVERANSLPENAELNEEVEDMVERTKSNPNALIFATVYSYPPM